MLISTKKGVQLHVFKCDHRRKINGENVDILFKPLISHKHETQNIEEKEPYIYLGDHEVYMKHVVGK